MNAYRTLKYIAVTEYLVQKSRFIGHAASVSTVEEALAFLEKVKKEHRNASHHCFAYIIGYNKGIIRYSDAGEPSGTAGKPIVEVMIAMDLVDCIVVVTRYFGGILLGSSGLLRAYVHSASLVLDAAGVCTMYETVRYQFNIAYQLWDKVDHVLQSLPVIIENTVYAESVKVFLLSRESDANNTITMLMKVTDGKIGTQREKDCFFYPWSE